MQSEESGQKMPDQASKRTVLSLRLAQIVSLVPKGRRVIDVGSDHGHVSAYLLENDICEYAVATDIHADPSEITRKYLRRQGLSGKSCVYCTDGLHGITLQKGDTIIISGLGGMEMIRILEESLFGQKITASDEITIILQPQRSIESVRNRIIENGFAITKEKICVDREKFYTIILSEKTDGKQEALSLAEQYLGPYILSEHPDKYIEYMIHQRNVLRKQARAHPELSDVLQVIDGILLQEPISEKRE